MTDERILLEARNIRKRFPGTLALDGVDFRVFAGKVHAVAGENGAGKSTLMNIISGTCTDFEGSLTVNARGVAMIHQELNLVPWMSVAENIFLGREPRTRAGLVDTKRMEREAGSILEGLGSTIDSRSPVHSLRVGEQQIVEIAKALSMQAEVLIMDEPTSSLSEKETEVLFGVVRDLASKGTGIVYITHKMAEISALADHVTILRDGRLIKEVPLKETSIDEIIRCMVGRDSAGFTHDGDRTPGETVLQVEGLSLQDPAGSGRARLSGIGFEVRAGEILGIYGLMGAGRTELLEAIFGCYPGKVSGKILLRGMPLDNSSTHSAVRQGLALLPEDRKLAGLVLGMDIRENVTLAALRSFASHGIVKEGREKDKAGEYRERLGIKSSSLRQEARELSGGNQQKVVLAKWLLTDPSVILLDEPTRGIDINAKNEIYRLLDELAREGKALVVVSSELPEIMAVCDRIITLRDGRPGGSFLREDFREESILKAALPEN